MLKCVWCDKQFERRSTRGPVPKYCSASHRQRAYEARRNQALYAEASEPRRRLRAVRARDSLIEFLDGYKQAGSAKEFAESVGYEPFPNHEVYWPYLFGMLNAMTREMVEAFDNLNN